MIDELLTALDWPLDEPAAEALMTAVTTDTGWLRFANTDARALRAVGRWIERGVRTDQLYKKLYQTDRPARLRLIARMLHSLELFCDDRLAAMRIRRADFAASGATAEDTDNLVNESLRIGSVDTALLLSEQEDGVVRVSLRSRDLLDVASVARRFGGGGHARAAGFRGEQDIDALKDRLVAACAEELARAAG
jgi:phosphoesterase RecJ-like protein